MVLNFLKNILQTGSKRPATKGSTRPTSFRPRLEPLEDRIVPAIWDGGGADNNWMTAANWDNNTAPPAGDFLIFPTGVPADSRANTNNFPAGTAFASIELRGNGYIIGGNQLALGTGGLLVTTGAHTLNAFLLLGGVRTFNVALRATLRVNGVLSGSGGLTKLGAGNLTLGGTKVNSYTGATNVNAGVLIIRKASALGSVGTGTTVATGAALQLKSGRELAFNTEPLTLNGAGIGGSGALLSFVGNNTWQGNITLASASTIGSLTNESFVSSLVHTGVLSGAGALTAVGGLVRLAGATANSNTGPTTVTGTSAVLILGKPAGVAALAGSQLTIGANSIARLANNEQIPNTAAVNVEMLGRFNLDGRTETIGNLIVTAGTVQTGVGQLVLNGNLTGNSALNGATPTQATLTGNLSLGGVSRTFTINDGPHNVDMLISAVISSGASSGGSLPAGLFKAGFGALQFTGNNTYNRTDINAGTLIVDGNQPGNDVSTNRGVFVNAGATLAGIGTVEPLTVNSGGTVSPTSIGPLSVNGNLTLNSGALFVAQLADVRNDQINVIGDSARTVSVSGATLDVQDGAPNRTSFQIIRNFTTGASSGNFILPDGYAFNFAGGTGNDVVLTKISATMVRELQKSLGGTTKFTGRVRAMLVRSDDPNTIWAAAATGGLWVSRDAGANWSRADDFLETLTFSSLVADPNNPDVMYAGSGEIFTFINEGMWLRAQDRGAGIFKTTNGGTTWTQLAATNNENFFYVSRIAVSPSNSNIVLAATQTGLFRSVDSGANWTRVVPASPTAPSITFLDVKFHPTDPSNAVATAHDQGIFYSVDLGASWQHAPLPSGLAEGTGSETRIELAPSISQPGTWFALHMDSAGGATPLVLIRSTTRGQTWTAVTGSPISFAGAQLNNNNRYSGALWVNPLNPDRILVGGLNLGLSTDGGRTFTRYPDPDKSLHNDHHALVTVSVTSTSTLAVVYGGNDGGVNRLDWPNDPRITPTNTLRNNNLVIQQFESAVMNPISGVVIGGAQDIGTLRRSADGVWTDLLSPGTAGADGIFVATDPTDSNFWYFGKTVGRIFRSRNGGDTGEDITPGDTLEAACFNLTPLLLDPTNPAVLYAGCHNLWRTLNAKALDKTTVTWSSILTVSRNHLITTMAVAPSNSNVMWVGTMLGTGGNPQNGHEVWRTTNLQAARTTTPTDPSPDFDLINISGLPVRPISRIAAHRSDPELAYVSFTGWADDGKGNLWKRSRAVSSSGVISFFWEDISVGLPPGLGPIYSVAVHPTIPNWIYAGTDVGLYVSHDDGANWSAITRGPARVPISDLTWVDDHRLIVATYGRGVFELDETPNPEQVIAEQVTYLTGNPSSGHLENLVASDGYRMVSGAGLGTTRMELTGRTGLPRAGVNLVGFRIESSTIDGSTFFTPQMTVELFNFVTGQYATVFNGAVGATDQSVKIGVAGPLAAELINAITGELRARVTWSGGVLLSSAIDRAHWFIDRPNTPTMVRDLQLSPENINEGDVVTLQGALTDPDADDFLTLTVNWGDGSPVQTRHPGTDPFRLTHRYRDNPAGQPSGGQYPITVTWFDQLGAGNSKDLFVTVNNVAPSVHAGGARTVYVGAMFARHGSFTDPVADTWTATVNYGDGSGVQPLDLNLAQRFTLRHRYVTPGSYTVVVTVRDDDGGVSTASFVVTVKLPHPGNSNGALSAVLWAWFYYELVLRRYPATRSAR